jgi:iron complex outermembrane receptor protein
LNGSWSYPLANGNEFFVNGNYVFTDEQQSGLPNNTGVVSPAQILPDYNIINLNAGLSFSDDRFRVTLIGKNLGDESYVTTFSGDGFRYQLPRDADRYFGISFRASY